MRRDPAKHTLGRDETLALFRELRTYCLSPAARAAARDRLVLDNVPLAGKLAASYRRAKPPRATADGEDLRGEAMLALVDAVDGFDPGLGCTFGAYLGRVVRRRLDRFYYQNAGPLFLPAHSADALSSVRVGRQGHRSAHHLDDALRAHAAPLSASEPLGDDTPAAPDPADAPEPTPDAAARVWRLLSVLPANQREVVALCYGIGRPAERRVDAAAVLGVTDSSLSRSESRALSRMRAAGANTLEAA